jgi:hypothetical protein
MPVLVFKGENPAKVAGSRNPAARRDSAEPIDMAVLAGIGKCGGVSPEVPGTNFPIMRSQEPITRGMKTDQQAFGALQKESFRSKDY